MNQYKLTRWMPYFDFYETTPEEFERLRSSFQHYVETSRRHEIFCSSISFRIGGFVHGRDDFRDGDPLLTTPVVEVTRYESDDDSAFPPQVYFIAKTRNSVYRLNLNDMSDIWLDNKA